MKISLIGFMGCGKSTFGRLLAEEYDLNFFDLDNLIELGEGKTIDEIFTEVGEEGFRDLETLYLKQFETKDKFILSCGGGTPCFNNNIEILNTYSTTVYLDVEPSILTERIFNDKSRPLVKGKSLEDLKLFIAEKISIRKPFYDKAKITLKEVTLEQLKKLL